MTNNTSYYEQGLSKIPAWLVGKFSSILIFIVNHLLLI
jgi:hypothetical protein